MRHVQSDDPMERKSIRLTSPTKLELDVGKLESEDSLQ